MFSTNNLGKNSSKDKGLCYRSSYYFKSCGKRVVVYLLIVVDDVWHPSLMVAILKTWYSPSEADSPDMTMGSVGSTTTLPALANTETQQKQVQENEWFMLLPLQNTHFQRCGERGGSFYCSSSLVPWTECQAAAGGHLMSSYSTSPDLVSSAGNLVYTHQDSSVTWSKTRYVGVIWRFISKVHLAPN